MKIEQSHLDGLSASIFWKCFNLSGLFDHDWVTVKGLGDFLIQIRGLFDNKYFDAGFPFAERLTCPYDPGNGHQVPRMIF